MNTTISEMISRKKKIEIRIPIILNTHLISKCTNQYATTIPKNDHAAALTFANRKKISQRLEAYSIDEEWERETILRIE